MTGDCYSAAAYAADLLEFPFTPTDGMTVVHGRPVFQGDPTLADEDGRYGHAWVELDLGDGTVLVLDRSNGRDIELRREHYYDLGRITDEHVTRYTQDEARAKLAEYRHFGPWDGSYPPIPYDELPDDEEYE